MSEIWIQAIDCSRPSHKGRAMIGTVLDWSLQQSWGTLPSFLTWGCRVSGLPGGESGGNSDRHVKEAAAEATTAKTATAKTATAEPAAA